MMLNHIILGASPPTGDSFPSWPLLIFILAALAAVTFVVLKRQNKKAAAADFAQIDLESGAAETSFKEDRPVNFMRADEENGYGADNYGEDYEDEYDDETEDAYEDDQRNFETEDGENDDDEEY